MEGLREACQSDSGSVCLMDLPEALLTNILRQLPLQDKCQAQAVCRVFRNILCSPFPGSFTWETISLDHPTFDAASPAALAGWLRQRAHGIRLLEYTPGPPFEIFMEAHRAQATSEFQQKQQIIIDVLPQLTALLSSEAEIHLNLRYAPAHAIFGSFEPSRGLPFVNAYWANLAANLTALKLSFASAETPEISALNHLSRLQRLAFDAMFPGLHIELSLPQLQKLKVLWGGRVTRLILSCPRLRSLHLKSMVPLDALQGVPLDTEVLSVKDLGGGALTLQEVFRGRRLEQLKRLVAFMDSLEVYEEPAMPAAIKQAISFGKLTELQTNCPLEKLIPLKGPQCALPSSLQYLLLWVPLEKGIPVILEQLTNLRKFSAYHSGKGPLHLNRPLDPFLDMPHFEYLELVGGVENWQAVNPHGWTADGLKFLQMAEKRIAEGSLMPRGRTVVLNYQSWMIPLMGNGIPT